MAGQEIDGGKQIKAGSITPDRLSGGSPVGEDLADAKGDIIVASGPNVFTRVPVGADDLVLTADPTAPTGVKWKASSAGGHIIMEEGSVVSERSFINFTGPGVSLSDDEVNDAIVVSIDGGGGGGGAGGYGDQKYMGLRQTVDWAPNLATGAKAMIWSTPFETNVWAEADAWSATNPTRFTAPDAGYYLVSWCLPIASQATPGLLAFGVRHNGGAWVSVDRHTPAANQILLLHNATTVYMAAGDYIELVVESVNSNTATTMVVLGGYYINPAMRIAKLAGEPSASGHTIQEEGTSVTTRGNLNFVGAGVAVTDDAANDRTLVTIPGGAGSELTPLQVPGLKMWHRASLIAAADGGAVATWPDASGNGHHLTATGTGQPTMYRTTSDRLINGKPVVTFDGTSDFLTVPNVLTSMTEGEVFVVLRADGDPTPSAGDGGLWKFGSDASAEHVPYIDGSVYDGWGSTARKTTGNPTLSLAVPRVYNVSSAPGAWTNRIDGVQHFTTAANVVGFSNGPTLGRGSTVDYWKGDIAELIIFARVLTATERSLIHAYLVERYGLAVSWW